VAAVLVGGGGAQAVELPTCVWCRSQQARGLSPDMRRHTSWQYLPYPDGRVALWTGGRGTVRTCEGGLQQISGIHASIRPSRIHWTPAPRYTQLSDPFHTAEWLQSGLMRSWAWRRTIAAGLAYAPRSPPQATHPTYAPRPQTAARSRGQPEPPSVQPAADHASGVLTGPIGGVLGGGGEETTHMEWWRVVLLMCCEM
jgi:hypothetical protein